jgi:hypothetical protein
VTETTATSDRSLHTLPSTAKKTLEATTTQEKGIGIGGGRDAESFGSSEEDSHEGLCTAKACADWYAAA